MIVLSIIILSYNTKDLTLKCIKSLINQYKKELEGGEFEIIIVDNASTDGSVKEISNIIRRSPNQISNIKLIKNKENLGFAKGCNIGANVSKGKYILFLNSDTEALDRGLVRMIEFLAENDKIGILGGRLLNSDGSSQASCGKFYNLVNLLVMLIGGERLGLLRKSPKAIARVDWVSGGCMMLRKSIFEKLKGFDEHFFMYVEDMELCFRARGLSLLTYFYPNVKIAHREHSSSNRAFAIRSIYKGILHFYFKHKGRFQSIIAKSLLVIKAKIGIFLGLISNNKTLINTYREAIKF